MLPLVAAPVNVVDFALLDATQHVQVVPVTVAVDVQLALAVVLITVRIHVQAAVQVAVAAAVAAVTVVKDAVIHVKQTVVAAVKNSVMLTVLVIVVDLVDLPASHYAEIAKILVMIHALAIAEQNVQIAATLTVLDHAKEVVVAAVTIVVVAVVRVALAHAKETVQVAVVDVPVTSYFNRSCGMRCYK